MDKYQEIALKQISFWLASEDMTKAIKDAEAKFEDDALIIKQGTDIKITKYSLVIFEREEFKCLKVSFYINQKWITPTECYKGHKNKLIFKIDLKKPIEKIKIEHVNKLIDTIELPVKIKMASVEEYNKIMAETKAKEEAERIAKTSELIKAEFKTGNDLVNIYWNIVSDEVKTVKLEVFLGNDIKFETKSFYKTIEDPITHYKSKKYVSETKRTSGTFRKIASFQEKTDVTFKAITGLAYGTYAFEITQFDGNGNILATTDKIIFKLIARSGRNEVVFGR